MEQFKAKIVVRCPSCYSMYKVAARLEGKTVTCTKCSNPFSAEVGAISAKKGEKFENSLLFCKVALNYGFINEIQLEKTLSEYTSVCQAGHAAEIETLFLRSGFLDEVAVRKINDIIPKWWIRQKEKGVAADAVAKGVLTAEKAKEILIEQAKIYNETGRIKWVKEFIAELSGNEERILPAGEAEDDNEKSQQPQTVDFSENTRKESLSDDTSGSVEPEKTEPVIKREQNVDDTVEAEEEPEKAADLQETDPVPDKPPTLVEKPVSDNEAEQVKTEEKSVGKLPPPQERPVEKKEDDEEISADVDINPGPVENDSIEDDENQVTKNINGLQLTLSSDRCVALLKAPDGIPPGTTVESIKSILENEGITYGVVDDALIKGFLNSRVFREKPFKIAEGKAAKEGVKGAVKYHFDTNPLTVGAVSESGEIDFRDRGEIPFVTEGALLAEITPAVIGENGIDIHGNVIAVPTINPINLRCEEGTEFSEDRLKVFAKNDGQPKLSIGDRIYVLSELKIPGDVGYETGHIEFDGNIVIGGTIQSDFVVRGANITANEILSAEVTATGDITVKNGIKGATIKAEGDVKAKYVNRGVVRAFGNVVVESEVIDSTIKNSGGCQVLRGKIISSEISSKQGIEAVEIGTEMSVPSKFRIGVDDHISDEVGAIETEIERANTFLEELKSKIETASENEKITHQTIAELAQLQDRTQLEVNALKIKMDESKKEGNDAAAAVIAKKIEELGDVIRKADDDVNTQFDIQDDLIETIAKQNELLTAAAEKIGVLKHEKRSLREWIKNQKTVSYIKTSRAMFAGTTIIGPHATMVLKETVKNVKIREIKNPDLPEGWEMRRV